MRILHPDLSFHTNFDEIARVIARYLDDIVVQRDGLTWFSGNPFLFSYKWDGSRYVFEFDFSVNDVETCGEISSDGYSEMLHDYIKFVPKVLKCCPMCRTTRVEDPSGFTRWGEACGFCHGSRMFYIFVTGKNDVRNFCERKRFKRPPNYGGLRT